jgi:hypothetical protein
MDIFIDIEAIKLPKPFHPISIFEIFEGYFITDTSPSTPVSVPAT